MLVFLSSDTRFHAASGEDIPVAFGQVRSFRGPAVHARNHRQMHRGSSHPAVETP
jgi:hypothetical protein